MWKSSADAVRDLNLISDFGGTNEEELKLEVAKATGYHTENAPCRFVDPRTGEEIDIRSEGRLGEAERRGKFSCVGRGKLIEEFRHSSKVKRLQKQLRMNRPLGFGNNMIESYFMNSKETKEPSLIKLEEPSLIKLEEPPLIKLEEPISDRVNTVKTTEVKKQNRNVLISSLLEKMESNGEKNDGNSGMKNEDLPVADDKKSNSSTKICESCRRDNKYVVVCSCKSRRDKCVDLRYSYKKNSRNESVDDDYVFDISQFPRL